MWEEDWKERRKKERKRESDIEREGEKRGNKWERRQSSRVRQILLGQDQMDKAPPQPRALGPLGGTVPACNGGRKPREDSARHEMQFQRPKYWTWDYTKPSKSPRVLVLSELLQQYKYLHCNSCRDNSRVAATLAILITVIVILIKQVVVEVVAVAVVE